MAVLKLPRMPDSAAIVDIKNGKPITALTRAWNSAMSQIETSVADIEAAIAAADAAQSDADAAMAAAIAAQADADAALAAAIAAQATADAAKATADALDAALNVTAGKVLTVLNTMTLAGIDGSTLNIGTGGTLGTAAYTNASDYLPSGTSLAFLPLAGGTLTGPLIVNSTVSVSGHTTFEGVTSTGATGTGRIVYDLSPVLTTPNIGAATSTSVTGATLTVGTNAANPWLWFANNAERGQVTAAGFVKASPTGTYQNATGTYHEFRTNVASNPLAVMVNTSADPYGLSFSFSGASPNDAGHYFGYYEDSTALRIKLQANGGLANYSANNVNLSDANVKGAVERYSETDLDALERSFLKVNWGRFKYLDQSHDDWNHGYTAQGVESAFALTAPELVDETELGTKAGSGETRKGVYDADLTHIGLALLARGLKRIEAVEGKMYAAGIT